MNNRQKWNKIFSDPDAYFHKGLENEIDKVLKLKPTSCRALDLGCGRGELVKYLFDKGYDVLGVDISDLALKQASRISGAKFHNDDIEKFIIPKNSYDLIFLKFVYAFVGDKIKLLKGISEGLSIDGLFVLITPVFLKGKKDEVAVLEQDLELVKKVFALVREDVLFDNKEKKLIMFILKNK